MLQMKKIHLKSIAKKTPNYQTRDRQFKKLKKDILFTVKHRR